MLFLRTVVPQQSFVGVLVDDSRSMTIGDAPDVARGAAALDLLGAEGGDLLGVLGQRFKVRLFSFSDDLRRVSSPAELRFQGGSSRLGAALVRGADELDAVPARRAGGPDRRRRQLGRARSRARSSSSRAAGSRSIRSASAASASIATSR